MYYYNKIKSDENYVNNYRNKKLLFFLSDKKIIEKLCLKDIKIDSRSFLCFDEEHKTEKVCLRALYINGYYLANINKKKQTYEMALLAVLSRTEAIQFVRKKFRKRVIRKILEPHYQRIGKIRAGDKPIEYSIWRNHKMKILECGLNKKKPNKKKNKKKILSKSIKK